MCFTLTTTASIAMAYCENMKPKETNMPCHDLSDVDQENTGNIKCCDDMASCKIPLIYGSLNSSPDMNVEKDELTAFYSNTFFAGNSGPPIPPPKDTL